MMDKRLALQLLTDLINTHDVEGLSIIRLPEDNGEYQEGAINVNLQMVYTGEDEKEDEFKTL
jgi:hypothetical protein